MIKDTYPKYLNNTHWDKKIKSFSADDYVKINVIKDHLSRMERNHVSYYVKVSPLTNGLRIHVDDRTQEIKSIIIDVRTARTAIFSAVRDLRSHPLYPHYGLMCQTIPQQIDDYLAEWNAALTSHKKDVERGKKWSAWGKENIKVINKLLTSLDDIEKGNYPKLGDFAFTVEKYLKMVSQLYSDEELRREFNTEKEKVYDKILSVHRFYIENKSKKEIDGIFEFVKRAVTPQARMEIRNLLGFISRF